MWLGSPRFRDSESLATGLVALWFLGLKGCVHRDGDTIDGSDRNHQLTLRIYHFFIGLFENIIGGAGFLPSTVWFMMDPFLPSISLYVNCFGFSRQWIVGVRLFRCHSPRSCGVVKFKIAVLLFRNLLTVKQILLMTPGRIHNSHENCISLVAKVNNLFAQFSSDMEAKVSSTACCLWSFIATV